MNPAIFRSSYIEDDQDPRFQCRHIKTSGHRCQCPALRGEKFCYYHHTTRQAVPKRETQRRKSKRGTFDMPFPEDRASIQHTLGMIIQRLGTNDLDPRRAGLLLYALQIASSNLPKEDPKKKPMPTVDEIILDPEAPELGPLAPETPFNPDQEPKGPGERYIDSILRRGRAEDAARAEAEASAETKDQTILPTLQATAETPTPPLTPIPSGFYTKTPREDTSTPPNRRTPSRPRLPIAQVRMVRTRISHLRRPSRSPHPPIRFLPRRQHRVLLLPVRHRRLIAPLHQVRHRLLMIARQHVSTHGLLALPRRHRPERPLPIRQQAPTQKPLRPLHLPVRPQRVPRKRRHKPNRPHSQPRKTDEDHTE
jgi:hypothetical protein